MKKIVTGKTKDVYELDNSNFMLKFKDDVTGKDGVFDPGANEVGLSIEGSGHAGLSLTKYFFERFSDMGIATHYIASDLEENTMEVKKAHTFGAGLECICRYKAVGSFYRRYSKFTEEGIDLDGFVEITVKDDAAGDPPISKEALVMLGVTTEEEADTLYSLTRKISDDIKGILAEKGLDLYDIKLEFGKDSDGNIMLIDEVSGGNMRVYRGDEYIEPLKLPELILG